MTDSVRWSEDSVEIAGIRLHYMCAGNGPPIMLLHHDIGTLDRLPFYDALARHFNVLVPHHPGYGKSQRPDWMRHPRDIAVIYQAMLFRFGISRARLVGLGFGGWIAAEMATMSPLSLHRLVLVGAMGIKPPEGEILDQALLSYIDYSRAGFHDQKAFARVYGEEPSTDQLVEWDVCREMNFRIAWKPYMYSQTLPHLLRCVDAPAMLVWGDNDRVVPLSAGKAYAASLGFARLKIIADCGHCVDMEKPEELAKLVTDFIAQE